MNNKIVIGTKVETDGIDKGIEEIKEKTEQIKDIKLNADTQSIQETTETLNDIDDDFANVEQIVQEVTDTLNKMFGTTIDWREILQEMYDEPNEKAKDLSKTMQKIGNSIQSIGKSLLKTGLLMMGIQSAMSMWRQSFNRIKEGHPELEKAMTHIQGAIDVIVNKFVTTLEPYLPRLLEFGDKILNIILQIGEKMLPPIVLALEGILSLVEKIVDGLVWMYNNMSVVHFFTGTISTDTKEFSSNTEKFADNIRKANKETSKLRKQLMGFDEMNILNDDGTSGVANNIKNIINDINKPKNKNDVNDDEDKAEWYALELGANLGVVGAQAVEAVEGLKKSPLIERLFGTNKENKTESKDLIKLVKATIDDNIEKRNKAIEELKKQSWFQAMFGGETEYLEQAINGVKGATDEIFEAVRKGSYKVKDGYYEIKLASGQVVKYSKDEFNQLKSVVEAMGEAGKTSAEKTKTSWNETGTSVETTANNITENASENASQTTSLWQRAYNLITQSNQTEGQKQKQNSSKNTKETINDTKTQVDNYNKKPSTAKVQVKQDDKNNSKTTTKEIQNDVDKTKPTVKLDVEKNSLQKIHDKIKETLKFTLTFQGATGAIGGAGSIKASAKGSIINYPRLASGGIINRPGRGVMLANGGTIAGERGREAVIPLTDSGQMELLGQAIARNIIINLNNEVRLDGKQLARYTSKVMSDMQFSSNGGVI